MKKFYLWGQGNFFNIYPQRPYLFHASTQLSSSASWVWKHERSWPLPTHPPPFLIFSKQPKNILAKEIGCEVCTSSWSAWLVMWGIFAKQSCLPVKEGHPKAPSLQISRALWLFHLFREKWRLGIGIGEAASANDCPTRTLLIFYLSPPHITKWL